MWVRIARSAANSPPMWALMGFNLLYFRTVMTIYTEDNEFT